MKLSASRNCQSPQGTSWTMSSLGIGLGALLVVSSLFLPACSFGPQGDQQGDDTQDSVRVDDSNDRKRQTQTPGDPDSGDQGTTGTSDDAGDGTERTETTTTELESGIVIREVPIEYVTEDEYAEKLAAYDADYKDASGRYVGVWYTCSLPQGYCVPTYTMGYHESENPDHVNDLPAVFVEDSSPNRLSVNRLSNGMLAGAEDHGQISLQCSLRSYDEHINRNPEFFSKYQEGQAYVATTGVTYRMFVSSDSTIAFPQVNSSVPSTPSVAFSHVPEGTVHEFLNGLQIVADPGATQQAYYEEHDIHGD